MSENNRILHLSLITILVGSTLLTAEPPAHAERTAVHRCTMWDVQRPSFYWGRTDHPTTAQVEFVDWLIESEQKITRAGYEKQKELFRDKPVVCTFILENNGGISDLEVSVPSGSDATDQAALCLIQKASPFTFPADTKVGGRRMIIRFEYPSVHVAISMQMPDP